MRSASQPRQRGAVNKAVQTRNEARARHRLDWPAASATAMERVNGNIFAIPNPVMNKPMMLNVGRRASQKIGKPIKVITRDATKRVRLDQRRVRQLPAMRPTS